MKAKNRMISLIFIYSIVFTATAAAYNLTGTISNNSVAINGSEVQYGTNVTYSNVSGYYSLSNLTGTISVNFSKMPEYYSNTTSMNMISDLVLDVDLALKPTGNITGRVCTFPGCFYEDVILFSSRIRWFF